MRHLRRLSTSPDASETFCERTRAGEDHGIGSKEFAGVELSMGEMALAPFFHNGWRLAEEKNKKLTYSQTNSKMVQGFDLNAKIASQEIEPRRLLQENQIFRSEDPRRLGDLGVAQNKLSIPTKIHWYKTHEQKTYCMVCRSYFLLR